MFSHSNGSEGKGWSYAKLVMLSGGSFSYIVGGGGLGFGLAVLGGLGFAFR